MFKSFFIRSLNVLEKHYPYFLDKFFVPFFIVYYINCLMTFNENISNSLIEQAPVYDFHFFLLSFVDFLFCILFVELSVKAVIYRSYFLVALSISAFICFWILSEFLYPTY